MGFITWSNSSPDDASDAATIDDKSWRKLQDRAAKANPKMRDTFGKEAIADRQRGQANYKNRKNN